MFETLSERLGAILDKLTRKGALTDADVGEAMREVRVALLEADVALDVVRDFTEAVKQKAIGQEVVRSITPGQMVIKIVHDELVRMLGSDAQGIDLAATPPVVMMLVGLQGSGKTTTAAKLGKRLETRDKQKVLMASLDTRRPAAQEQLRVLGEQTGVATLPIVAGETPTAIAKRAIDAARRGGYDVLLLDTAGRTHIDDELMAETAAIEKIARPHETLLVADALTGQDAVNLAKSFGARVALTGIVLTRVDGDGRGGAALSMRAVTGKPIKLIGVGEKLDALEEFHPERIAGRILGMGDVVGLVEKAIQTVEIDKAEAIARKVKKGAFDLDDLAEQLQQMQKLGGMGGVLAMLPGIGKIKKQLDAANLDDAILKRQQAMIGSMTKAERKNPKLLNASRKKRVTAGSGTSVQDLNRLVKMHRQMADMMKAMGKKRGLLGTLFGGGPPPDCGRAARGAAEICRRSRQAAFPVFPAAFPDFPAASREASPACQNRKSDEINRNEENEAMSLKIRLARAGAKKRPYYRIVVANSRNPRDGRYIEKIGTYDPLQPKGSAERVKFVDDRLKHWLGVGAQPTDRVLRFLDAAGIRKRAARSNPNKGQPGKKRLEREEAKRTAATEKEKAAAEAAAAPPPAEPEVPAEQPAAEQPAAEQPAPEQPAAEEPAPEPSTAE